MADVQRLSREELGTAARELQERLAWVRDYLDPDGVQQRLDELSEELSQPGFWDDAKRAASVSSQHARLTRKLETYQAISSEIGDQCDTRLAELIVALIEAPQFRLAGAEEAVRRFGTVVDRGQARDRADQRRLAGARGPDEADHLAARDRQADIVQHAHGAEGL